MLIVSLVEKERDRGVMMGEGKRGVGAGSSGRGSVHWCGGGGLVGQGAYRWLHFLTNGHD